MSSKNRPSMPKPGGRPSPADMPQTPEAVAFALALDIMERELDAQDGPEEAETNFRRYLLTLYGECLGAVKGQ